MPSAIVMKLIGAGVGLLMLVGLVLGLKHYKALAESRGEKLVLICQTTRDAANNPKLACGQVAVQIAELGKTIDTLDAALDKQNAAVKQLGAETVRQQGEAAKASQAASKRADRAEATAERLAASSRSSRPSAVCEPSKTLSEAWR